MWYQTVVDSVVLSQSTRVSDGQTDRQNFDSQDRASIASRGNKSLPTISVPVSVRVQVKGPMDYSNFDSYPKDVDIPPDELSGWDKDF